MAESNTTTRRLTDWIVLVFVLVVTGLLVVGLAGNVHEATGHKGSTTDAAATIQSEADHPATH